MNLFIHSRENSMYLFAAIAFSLLAVSPVTSNANDRYLCQSSSGKLHQLRIYEVNRSNRDAFHRRFQDHALPIMRRHGFKIVDMWESDTASKLEFVYVLAWPDKPTMELRWKEFLADQEWIDVKRRTAAESGELVREVRSSQPLARVSYSPACTSTYSTHP